MIYVISLKDAYVSVIFASRPK